MYSICIEWEDAADSTTMYTNFFFIDTADKIFSRTVHNATKQLPNTCVMHSVQVVYAAVWSHDKD